MRIELVEGDVTAQEVDAIVNAANSSLLGGGGVDSCYTRSLAVADDVGAETVAFPLVSSGVYGWPLDDAVGQALTALRAAETDVSEARLVLFGREAYAVAEKAFAA